MSRYENLWESEQVKILNVSPLQINTRPYIMSTLQTINLIGLSVLLWQTLLNMHRPVKFLSKGSKLSLCLSVHLSSHMLCQDMKTSGSEQVKILNVSPLQINTRPYIMSTLQTINLIGLSVLLWQTLLNMHRPI